MTDGTAAANDAMIREFLRAWERRDTERIVDRFTDDGVYHSIPLTPIVGKDAIREFVAGFVGVPPGRLVVHHQVASETVVMNERTDYITLNGRPVTLPISGVFEIEDGRIKAWREYFDLAPAKAAYEVPEPGRSAERPSPSAVPLQRRSSSSGHDSRQTSLDRGHARGA